MAKKPEKRPPVPSTPQIAHVRLPEAPSIPTGRYGVPILQGPGTNFLATVSSTARNGAFVSFHPEANLVEVAAVSGKMRISFTGDGNPDNMSHFKVSTSKLMDALIIKFTQQNRYLSQPSNLHPHVKISLQEYLEMLGRSSDDAKKQKNQLDSLRKSVAADLSVLYNLSMDFEEQTGRKDKGVKNYRRMRVLSSVGINRATIEVTFSPELAAYLVGSYIMEYNLRLLCVNERIPAAYHLGRKIIQTLNFARRKNPSADSASISVSALLASCPDIPSFDEVAENGRRYSRDIIKPLQSALNGLDFIRWQCRLSNGCSITDLSAVNFREIADAIIDFSIIEEEDSRTPSDVRPSESKD